MCLCCRSGSKGVANSGSNNGTGFKGATTTGVKEQHKPGANIGTNGPESVEFEDIEALIKTCTDDECAKERLKALIKKCYALPVAEQGTSTVCGAAAFATLALFTMGEDEASIKSLIV